MKKTYLVVLAAICLLMACKDEQKKQELIDQEVKSAIESFRQKKRNECRAAVIDSANKLADSIVLARNTVVDTTLVNGKP